MPIDRTFTLEQGVPVRAADEGMELFVLQHTFETPFYGQISLIESSDSATGILQVSDMDGRLLFANWPTPTPIGTFGGIFGVSMFPATEYEPPQAVMLIVVGRRGASVRLLISEAYPAPDDGLVPESADDAADGLVSGSRVLVAHPEGRGYLGGYRLLDWVPALDSVQRLRGGRDCIVLQEATGLSIRVEESEIEPETDGGFMPYYPSDGQTWGRTMLSSSASAAEAGEVDVTIMPAFDFRLADITFRGSTPGSKITRVLVGGDPVWSDEKGIDCVPVVPSERGVNADDAFHDAITRALRRRLYGRVLRTGDDFVVRGSVPAAGQLSVVVVGRKPVIFDDDDGEE